MKSLLIALLFVGGSALAEEATVAPRLSCEVPVENAASAVKLEVTLGTDASVDFVTLSLTGPGINEILFMQMDKGAFAESLKNGSFQTLLIQEGFAVTDGVYNKAGIISVQKDAKGVYTGLLSALGNIYPLACK